MQGVKPAEPDGGHGIGDEPDEQNDTRNIPYTRWLRPAQQRKKAEQQNTEKQQIRRAVQPCAEGADCAGFPREKAVQRVC